MSDIPECQADRDQCRDGRRYPATFQIRYPGHGPPGKSLAAGGFGHIVEGGTGFGADPPGIVADDLSEFHSIHVGDSIGFCRSLKYATPDSEGVKIGSAPQDGATANVGQCNSEAAP